MFIYTFVNAGSEKLLKEEVQIKYPELHFAYSKPGFVTFKSCSESCNTEKLELIFARAVGVSLGKSRAVDIEEKIAEYGIGRKIHKYNLKEGTTAGERAVTGDEVFDIIEVSEDEFWLGIRKINEFDWKTAGALPAVTLPENAPSRAYLKIEEGIELTNFSAEENSTVLEIGSAPGGASFAMLERGYLVYGVDTGEMDKICIENKNFTHLKMAMQKLNEYNMPEKVDTLLCDVNLDPYEVIPQLLRILELKPEIKTVFYTLKIGKKVKIRDIPDFLVRFERAGFNKIKATQLPSNRSEIMVYCSK